MKILHVNTHDRAGGAAIAARRIHAALRAAGQDSALLALEKTGAETDIRAAGGKIHNRIWMPVFNRLEKLPEKIFYSRPEHPAYCSFGWLPNLAHRKINSMGQDITHLHWITGGFISLRSLARLAASPAFPVSESRAGGVSASGLQSGAGWQPVIWTLHDTWAFTGGCHFFTDCDGYKTGCGNCPQLKPLFRERKIRDLSRKHWLAKKRAVDAIRPVIVSPSRAYAQKAGESALLGSCRVEHIPNCLDCSIFKPLDRGFAREALNLPPDAKIIFFSAMSATTDHNKGFDLLLEALERLKAMQAVDPERVVCLVAGSAAPENTTFPFAFRFLGELRDEYSLALAYNSSDLFVCPSRQESFSNTVMEALACGIPAVGFRVGALPEMISQRETGYIAQPYDVADLTAGIAVTLELAETRKNEVSTHARENILLHNSPEVIARRYMDIYAELLQV